MTVWRPIQVFSLLAAALLVHQPVVALDINWIGAPGVPGDWGDESNWSIQGGPIPSDKAIINNAGIAQVTDTRQIAGFNVAQSGSTGGTLEILAGGWLINTGFLSVGSSATGEGTLRLNGGDYNGGLSNDFVGGGGTGTIEVTAGTFTSGGGGMFFGNGGNGHGILDVSGTGTYSGGGMQLGFGASESTVSLTGDTASIEAIRIIDTNVGGIVNFNLTPGPSGINPITIPGTMSGGRLRLNGDNDILNVDLTDYAFGSSSLILFSFENVLEDDFETINIIGGTGTLVYDTSSFPREVRLEQLQPAGLPGDFNGDDAVDAADYTVWRDNLGSGTPLPNDNGLGTPIGSAHYDLWKSEFGNAAPAVAAVSMQVPEPTAWLLALVALAMGWRRVPGCGASSR